MQQPIRAVVLLQLSRQWSLKPLRQRVYSRRYALQQADHQRLNSLRLSQSALHGSAFVLCLCLSVSVCLYLSHFVDNPSSTALATSFSCHFRHCKALLVTSWTHVRHKQRCSNYTEFWTGPQALPTLFLFLVLLLALRLLYFTTDRRQPSHTYW